MSEVIVMQDGFMIGTWLARYFGLDSRYFSKLNSRKSITLNHLVEVKSFEGIVFVSIPKDIQQHIREGYMAGKIESGDDLSEYDHVFDLTNQTKIGFWI